MGISPIGYFDPVNHRFVRTGWRIKFLKWEKVI